LLNQNPALTCPTWGSGSSAKRAVREAEGRLEGAVSKYLGRMTILYLPLGDESGGGNMRGHIERDAIALLSNFERPAIDPPSAHLLGRCCPRAKVQQSGLWNSDHVDEEYDPKFLTALEQVVARAQA
jgi:hypothetical protein